MEVDGSDSIPFFSWVMGTVGEPALLIFQGVEPEDDGLEDDYPF